MLLKVLISNDDVFQLLEQVETLENFMYELKNIIDLKCAGCNHFSNKMITPCHSTIVKDLTSFARSLPNDRFQLYVFHFVSNSSF